MRHSWSNALLVVFIAAELVSGALGLVTGSEDWAFHIQAHRFAGYGLLAVIGWKVAQVAYSLRRRRRSLGVPRAVSLALAAAFAVCLGLGLWWSVVGPFRLGPFSGLSWHIYVGAAVAPLAAWHAVAYARGIRLGYWADRRTFLRLAGATAAGLALWQAAELGSRVGGLAAAGRRFTGSYRHPAPRGGPFPVVYWLSDRTPAIDPERWRLAVTGMVAEESSLGLGELDERTDMEALLDCTGGWYTVQTWSGVPVSRVLGASRPLAGARSVTVTSVTGYYRRFPLDEAGSLMLATHVGGRPLSPGHGHPVRLVAPGRRGFEWVKWVAALEVSDVPHWWQPPIPLR